MRIVLVSSFVPFINGGARFIVEWLEEKLLEHGHQVEHYYLPFVDYPDETLQQMAAFRLIDLTDYADRVICFRPPAYAIDHPNKVLWFIHHLRSFYDLWETPYGARSGTQNIEAVKKAVVRFDTQAISEARHVYTNSQVVSDRLKRFNGLDSEPLYPPIYQPERFSNAGYGDEIVYVCRVEPHKRQELLVEAMAHTTTGVKLRLCGVPSNPGYGDTLRARIAELGVEDKVIFEDAWITEAEKAAKLSTALAAAYIPKDEDSYGYPSLEAAHSQKPVITCTDSGGTLELIEDGRNGLLCAPDARALASAMDRLYADRPATERMGQALESRLKELRIDWHRVVEAMTA